MSGEDTGKNVEVVVELDEKNNNVTVTGKVIDDIKLFNTFYCTGLVHSLSLHARRSFYSVSLSS